MLSTTTTLSTPTVAPALPAPAAQTELARRLVLLGALYLEQGDLGEAEPFFRYALEAGGGNFGGSSGGSSGGDGLRSYFDLFVSALRGGGRAAESEALARQLNGS
jgi:hypothetical protein